MTTHPTRNDASGDESGGGGASSAGAGAMDLPRDVVGRVLVYVAGEPRATPRGWGARLGPLSGLLACALVCRAWRDYVYDMCQGPPCKGTNFLSAVEPRNDPLVLEYTPAAPTPPPSGASSSLASSFSSLWSYVPKVWGTSSSATPSTTAPLINNASVTFSPKQSSTLLAHSGRVTAVAWMDDKGMVSTSFDSTVLLTRWSNDYGAVYIQSVLRTHSNSLLSCDTSPSGSIAVAGGMDGILTAIDTNGRSIINDFHIDHSEDGPGAMAVKFVDNDHVIVGCSDGTCIALSLQGWKQSTSFSTGKDEITCISHNPVFNLLAVSTLQCAKIYDLRCATKQAVTLGSGWTSDITSISLSPSGHIVATGGTDSSCSVYDIRLPSFATGTLKHPYYPKHRVITHSPTAFTKPLTPPLRTGVSGIGFSSSGYLLASYCDPIPEVRGWCISTSTPQCVWTSPNSFPLPSTCLSVNRTYSAFAVGSRDKQTRLFFGPSSQRV